MDDSAQFLIAPSVLVVCRANVCRSRVAEKILSDSMASQGMVVKSAGTHPAESTTSCARTHQFGVANRSPQGISTELAKHADLILVMEKAHRTSVFDWEKNALGKTFLLSEFSEIVHQLAVGADFEFDTTIPSGNFKDWFRWVVKEAYIARTYLKVEAFEILDPHIKQGSHSAAFTSIADYSQNILSDILTIIQSQQSRRVE